MKTERERIEVNSNRVCFNRSLRLKSRSAYLEVFSDSEVGRMLGVFVFFLSVSLLMSSTWLCLLILSAFFFFAVLSSEFQLNPSVSQTLSFSEKRGTSGTVSVRKHTQKGKDGSRKAARQGGARFNQEKAHSTSFANIFAKHSAAFA